LQTRQGFIEAVAHSFGFVKDEAVEDNVAGSGWWRRELEGGEF
jgi:hypothetical protein